MLDSLVSAFIKYEHSNFFSATVYNLYKPIKDIKPTKKNNLFIMMHNTFQLSLKLMSLNDYINLR